MDGLISFAIVILAFGLGVIVGIIGAHRDSSSSTRVPTIHRLGPYEKADTMSSTPPPTPRPRDPTYEKFDDGWGDDRNI